MRIPYDFVCIKPYPTDEIRTKSGHVLYLDIRFEEQRHAQTAGVVVGVPEKLRFNADIESNSLDFDTDMELKVGDTVIFNYLAAKHSRDLKQVSSEGEIFIPYDKIYAALRDGDVVCVNGYILVEPEEDIPDMNFIVPDTLKEKSKNLGKVVYSGTPNRGYHKFQQFYPDDEIPVGSRVLFHWTDAIPIQPDQELHGEITKQKMLYRMQHKDVLAVIPDGVDVRA